MSNLPEVKSFVDQWIEARKEAETKKQFEQELRDYIDSVVQEATEKDILFEIIYRRGYTAGHMTGRRKAAGVCENCQSIIQEVESHGF